MAGGVGTRRCDLSVTSLWHLSSVIPVFRFLFFSFRLFRFFSSHFYFSFLSFSIPIPNHLNHLNYSLTIITHLWLAFVDSASQIKSNSQTQLRRLCSFSQTSLSVSFFPLVRRQLSLTQQPSKLTFFPLIIPVPFYPLISCFSQLSSYSFFLISQRWLFQALYLFFIPVFLSSNLSSLSVWSCFSSQKFIGLSQLTVKSVNLQLVELYGQILFQQDST